MSNRQSILLALQKHGASTYDELEQNTRIERNKLRFSVNDAKKAGHIKVDGKCPVTNQQTYSLTDAGKNWMFEFKMPGDAVKALEKNGTAMPDEATVKDSLTAQMPTDKACCNAAKVMATTAGSEIDKLILRVQGLEQDREKQRTLLESKNEEIEAIQDDIRRQIQRAEAAESNRDDIKQTLDQANRANDFWYALAGEFECKSIPELRVFINSLVERTDKLKAENTALTVLNADMPAFGAVYMATQAKGFVVRTPNKPPRYTAKHSTAHSAAMSAARRHGLAEVFALVPVGKAVRGAEWKEAA